MVRLSPVPLLESGFFYYFWLIMENQNQRKLTPKLFITTLTILFTGILFGVLIFVVVILTQFRPGFVLVFDTSNPFFFVVPLAYLGGVFMGKTILNKKIAGIQQLNGLKAKLLSFQTGYVLSLALIEMPVFVALVAYMLTSDVYYLFMAGLGILYLLTLFPTKEKIKYLLNLPGNEASQFEDADAEL